MDQKPEVPLKEVTSIKEKHKKDEPDLNFEKRENHLQKRLEVIQQATSPSNDTTRLEQVADATAKEEVKSDSNSENLRKQFPLPHYEIIKELGRGRHGLVVSAIYMRTGKKVAIKRMKFEFASKGANYQRVWREV